MKLDAQRALRSLGIHLSEPLPTLLLAGLATDRRLLLIGPPGQAKTALVRALGERLAPGRTRVLNAALTSFDDVRGFVRPASLDAGKAEIVPGPWSPYEDALLFVDELSRAPATQQNRWLQLIHERLVDGQPTALRWVLAAMNPPSIEGTFPLGWATVDRFHAVLELEDFAGLEPAVKIAIAAGLVAPQEHEGAPEPAGLDLAGHLAAIRARADRLWAEPVRRVMLARITVAALDAFRQAGGPLSPQGRRAVLMTELLASLLAALEVAHGDDALQALGDQLDAWLTAGLTALGRAADVDETSLGRAHDAAWGAAIRAWEQAFEVRGPRAWLAQGGGGEGRPARRERLEAIVRAELTRRSLDAERFTQAAAELWREHAPEGFEGRRVTAIQYLDAGAITLEGVEIPFTDKLVHCDDRRVHIRADGGLDRELEAASTGLFAEAPLRKPVLPPWPVPFEPIAIVLPGPDRDEEALAAAVAKLGRPAYCVPSDRVTCGLRGLADAPVIRSSAVLAALGRMTRAGIFHPERAARDKRARGPLILFGVPHRAWRDLAALTHQEVG